MLNIQVDVISALSKLQNFRVDQLPFAVSRTINKCADEARKALIGKVGSTYKFKTGIGWIRGGGAMGKGWFFYVPSTKRNLFAIVSSDPVYTYLYLYSDAGGTSGIKIARKRYLAVPLGNLMQRRIPPDLRPKAIMASGFGIILNSGANQFIAVRSRKAGWGVIATAPRLKGLQLLYLLVPMIKVAGQKVLNMESIVRDTVNKTFPEQFRLEMENAIRTAR